MTQIGPATEGWLIGRLARREINDLTAEKYRYHLRSFARFVGQDRPIDDIVTEDIEGWLMTVTGRDGPPRPRTINTKMIPIRAFFSWAHGRDVIATDPARPVKRARNEQLRPRRLPPETCARLLHVSDFRQTTVILLGLHLGLRACEVSRANIQDWDPHAKTLLVHGKGGKERTLPVDGEIEMALGMWVDHINHRRGPMFPAQATDDRISPTWAGQLVTSAARLAKVNATSHQLRHTCASDLVARGVPVPIVQRLLGHASLATTTTYVVADMDEVRHHIVGRQYRIGGGVAAPV